MDNEQRIELHEEIKDYLKGALAVTIISRCIGNYDKVEVEITLDGEHISSDTFEIFGC